MANSRVVAGRVQTGRSQTVLSFFGRKGSEAHGLQPTAASIFPALRAVEYRSDNDPLAWFVNFVHNDVGQARHDPFKRPGNVSDMSHARKRNQQFNAAEEALHNALGSSGTVL